MRKSRAAFFICATLSALSNFQAQAHEPVPLLPLKISSLNHFLRIPRLSAANSARLSQTRQIISSGVNSGISQSLTRALQGPVVSGQLSGTYYESISDREPFNVFQQPKFQIAFGSNPLSTNGFQGTGTITGALSNQIIFGSLSNHVSKAAGIVPLHYLSGSQRAAQNQITLLTKASILQGEKMGNAEFSSPIVAGQFFGTNYFQLNTAAPPFTYASHGLFDYAFGSDPLNVNVGGGTNLNLSILRNYIQLANGKVFTYSSGELFASGYFRGVFQGNRIFAIGSSPLNYFNDYSAVPASVTYTALPQSYLFR